MTMLMSQLIDPLKQRISRLYCYDKIPIHQSFGLVHLFDRITISFS